MKRLYLLFYLLFSQLFLSLTVSAENISKLVKDPVFGGSVYVQLAGDKNKPAVVLIHGLGESASQHWQHTIDLLKPNYRVFTLDLPGFGKSDKGNHLYSPENYATLIQRLTQTYIGKSFHLVGHSMGGAIALYYAAQYTNDVKTLTLIDAAGILHRVAYSKHLAVLGVQQLFADRQFFNENTILGWAGAILGRLEPRLPVDPALILSTNFSREKFLQGNPSRIAGLALISEDFSPLPHKVRAPTLIIWGEQDKIAPLRTGYVLDAVIPTSVLHVLPGVSHTPVSEAPHVVHGLLQAHLRNNVNSTTWKKTKQASSKYVGNDFCKSSSGDRYSGHIGELTIQNCRHVLIEDAIINRLILENSSVTILNSTISNRSGTAIHATNSSLSITASKIIGRTGIITNNASLDIAGSKFVITDIATDNVIIANGTTEIVFSLVHSKNATLTEKRFHGTTTMQHGDTL